MNEFELQTQVEKLRTDYRSKYESFPIKKMADGSEARDIPANELEGLRKLHDDLNTAAQQLDEARSFRKVYDRDYSDQAPANLPQMREAGKQVERRSIGTQVIETANYRDALYSNGGIPIEFRASMLTGSNGYTPEVVREGTHVAAISKPIGLLDFLTVVPTNQNATLYMKQTVRTNAANPKAEGAALDESTITWVEQTSPIYDVGTYIPVSKNQLDDVDGLQSLVDNDLMLMVRQELDYQVTVGTGVAPNLTGAYTGASYTQARSTDPHFDAVMKAMTKVRTANGTGGRGGRLGAPNLVLLNPTDWQTILLQRTADGIYLYGNPSDSVMTRIWGVQVAESLHLTAGNGLVLDTSFLKVRMRKQAQIAVSESDGNDFVKRMLKIRADLRAGLEIYSGEALCTVTGL